MKKFFFVFLCSNLAYWIAALFRGYVSVSSSIVTEGILYFFLTWWLLWKYKDDGESIVRILFPLFFGLFWLELPYRIVGINDAGLYFTMFHLLTTPIAIMLSLYGYRQRNYIVSIIGIVCWFLLALVGNVYWTEYAQYGSLESQINLSGQTIIDVEGKKVSIDECQEKFIVIYLHTGPLFDLDKHPEFIKLTKNSQVRFVESLEDIAAFSPRAKHTPTIIILNDQRDVVFKGSIRFATYKLKNFLFNQKGTE